MILWALLLLISAEGHAQTGGAQLIRFADLPALVRKQNENVKAAENMHLAESERSGFLTRSFLPKISARAGDETFKSGSRAAERKGFWMLEGRVNLYRGGRDQLESRIREANQQIAKSQYAQEFNQELMKARQTYWKLVSVARLIKDRQEALQKNESYISSSRRRSGAGLATSADALQFELHKTLLQQELKKLILEQDLLRNRLSVAIGWSDHDNMRVPDDFPHPKEEKAEAGELNVQSNIRMKIAAAREAQQRARAKQNQRWWLPQVDVYSSYGLPSIGDEYSRALANQTEWIAGVQIGLDLTDGLEARREARAKALEAKAEKSRAEYNLRQITAADHELRHDLKLLHELIHDSDKDNAKAEAFLKLTRSEYTRGVRNGPDLLGAFKTLYEFRERRTALYQQYHETQAELTALLAEEEASLGR